MKYKDFGLKSIFQNLIEFCFTIFLSILSRILPKSDFEIYGSMNGFKICDNSKFLFNNTSFQESYFITKNKEIFKDRNYKINKKIIFAYSLRGIYLQLRAKKIYWTHGLNDFIPPLVIGSYIVGLQHGLPGKNGQKFTKFQIFKFKIKNIIAPYLNNYYCHEVWSPKEIYDDYIKEVFFPLKITIKRKQIPRIAFQPNLKKKRKILYAPSHRPFRSIIDVINANKIFDNDFLKKLSEKNIELIFRPHPIDYDEILNSKIDINCNIDSSDDIHDELSSYSMVISDFSGLLIDCWELGIETLCLCDDLEDIYKRDLIFDWFFIRLKTKRLFNSSQIINNLSF